MRLVASCVVPATCPTKRSMWTVRRTSPCDQIKINQSQIGTTSSHNSLRTLIQEGGSRGRRWLERHFHQNANPLQLLSLCWPHLIGNNASFSAYIRTDQRQFEHWTISLNTLRFVLSWFISMLHCYFNNFGCLRKLQSVKEWYRLTSIFAILSGAIGPRV